MVTQNIANDLKVLVRVVKNFMRLKLNRQAMIAKEDLLAMQITMHRKTVAILLLKILVTPNLCRQPLSLYQ